MSGGSWNYVSRAIEETAARLEVEEDPDRRALGAALKPFARALHEIEWVDSCDTAPGTDRQAITAVLASTGRSRLAQAGSALKPGAITADQVHGDRLLHLARERNRARSLVLAWVEAETRARRLVQFGDAPAWPDYAASERALDRAVVEAGE